MKTETLFIIVSLAQLYYSGYHVGGKMEWQRTPKERFVLSLIGLIIALFGAVILVGIILLTAAGFIWFKLLGPLNLHFIVKYILLKRPFAFNNHGLEEMRGTVDKLKLNWWNWHNRSFKYCYDWINKNYPA